MSAACFSRATACPPTPRVKRGRALPLISYGKENRVRPGGHIRARPGRGPRVLVGDDARAHPGQILGERRACLVEDPHAHDAGLGLAVQLPQAAGEDFAQAFLEARRGEIRERFAKPLLTTQGEGNHLSLELGGEKTIDHIVLREDIRGGERVRKFVVEGKRAGGEWLALAARTRATSSGQQSCSAPSPPSPRSTEPVM